MKSLMGSFRVKVDMGSDLINSIIWAHTKDPDDPRENVSVFVYLLFHLDCNRNNYI